MDIQKSLRKVMQEDASTNEFMQKQINQMKYQEAEIQYQCAELDDRQTNIQNEIGNDDDIWYF